MDAPYTANMVVSAVIVTLSVFGNCLVMISVKKFYWLKTATNYFVAMLAFYDFCNGLPIFTMQLIEPDIALGNKNITQKYEICCFIHTFLNIFSGYGNPVCIIIVRYFFINWPLRYHGVVTSTKALVVSILSFVAVVSTSILGIYGRRVQKPCSIFRMYSPYFINYVGLPTLALAMGLVFLLYGKNDQLGSQNKVTKVISLVIGVFMLTYISIVISLLGTSYVPGQLGRWIQLASIWIWRVSRPPLEFKST